eukprot:4301878-Prymnesium_polylepis.1
MGAERGRACRTPPTTLVHDLQGVAHAVEAAASGAGGGTEGGGRALWYLKQPGLQRGQGITILSETAQAAPVLMAAEESGEAAAGLVLQRAVAPPALINGRKFGLRVHLLLVLPPPAVAAEGGGSAGGGSAGGGDGGGSGGGVAAVAGRPLVAWVHGDAVLTMCGSAYDEARTDAMTHITCTSVQARAAGCALHAAPPPSHAESPPHARRVPRVRVTWGRRRAPRVPAPTCRSKWRAAPTDECRARAPRSAMRPASSVARSRAPRASCGPTAGPTRCASSAARCERSSRVFSTAERCARRWARGPPATWRTSASAATLWSTPRARRGCLSSMRRRSTATRLRWTDCGAPSASLCSTISQRPSRAASYRRVRERTPPPPMGNAVGGSGCEWGV